MSSNTITIQTTNNDTIVKFISTEPLISGGSYEYSHIDGTEDSPLAKQLFYLPFVKKIFITANFIAIQRFDTVSWDEVQDAVKEQIEAFLKTGNAAVIETKNTRKKNPIEVYAEATPNPVTMKFGTNKMLTSVDLQYKNIEEASKSSPLAQELFKFPFVKEVFISQNYVSITKYDVIEWDDIYLEIRTSIRTFLQEGKTSVKEQPEQGENKKITQSEPSNLDETSAKIVGILDEYIRPAVASDGGNIAFKSYDKSSKVVSVILQGACSGCPSSTATLKGGIEIMLKEMLPNQVSEVVAINE